MPRHKIDLKIPLIKKTKKNISLYKNVGLYYSSDEEVSIVETTIYKPITADYSLLPITAVKSNEIRFYTAKSPVTSPCTLFCVNLCINYIHNIYIKFPGRVAFDCLNITLFYISAPGTFQITFCAY